MSLDRFLEYAFVAMFLTFMGWMMWQILFVTAPPHTATSTAPVIDGAYCRSLCGLTVGELPVQCLPFLTNYGC